MVTVLRLVCLLSAPASCGTTLNGAFLVLWPLLEQGGLGATAVSKAARADRADLRCLGLDVENQPGLVPSPRALTEFRQHAAPRCLYLQNGDKVSSF